MTVPRLSARLRLPIPCVTDIPSPLLIADDTDSLSVSFSDGGTFVLALGGEKLTEAARLSAVLGSNTGNE